VSTNVDQEKIAVTWGIEIFCPKSVVIFWRWKVFGPVISFGPRQILVHGQEQARNKFDSYWAWFIIAIIFLKEVIPGVSANDSH
jgi:hypothetical protein